MILEVSVNEHDYRRAANAFVRLVEKNARRSDAMTGYFSAMTALMAVIHDGLVETVGSDEGERILRQCMEAQFNSLKIAQVTGPAN